MQTSEGQWRVAAVASQTSDDAKWKYTDSKNINSYTTLECAENMTFISRNMSLCTQKLLVLQDCCCVLRTSFAYIMNTAVVPLEQVLYDRTAVVILRTTLAWWELLLCPKEQVLHDGEQLVCPRNKSWMMWWDCCCYVLGASLAWLDCCCVPGTRPALVKCCSASWNISCTKGTLSRSQEYVYVVETLVISQEHCLVCSPSHRIVSNSS